jgi:hypothetical protein
MAFKVVILPGVYADMDDAYSYYEHLSPELAERFFNEYLNCLNEIERNPNYFSFYNSAFRRIQLPGFPYIVIFRIVTGKIVLVSTLVYAGRNPSFITQQLSRK